MDADTELVRALQEDGRASIRALAYRLGQHRDAVAARLRSLVDRGAVRVVAAVDPVFLGQHVLAHVSIRTRGPLAPLTHALGDFEEAVLVSAIGGSHDLVMEVRLGTTAALHELLARVRAMHGVERIDTLVYSAVLKGFFVSDYRGEASLDSVDIALIEQLQKNGRASYRALGESVRLSASAVTTRVRRLIDSGVIRISVVEARGVTQRQLSMGVGLSLSSDDDSLVEAARAWRSVDFAALTVGRFDAVMTIVEPSAGDLHETLERIRALPGVVNAETWLHLRVHKEDYARTLRSPMLLHAEG